MPCLTESFGNKDEVSKQTLIKPIELAKINPSWL